ncbi:MAG: FtsX-like permease family protein [Acidobacteria bacterium]|nr:FtsX-like permease family protein [Acidobacteriota bacterium]
MKIENFIAFRYLKARRNQAFIGTITLISVLGIIIGVMSLIIALSLMTGFHNKMEENLLSANSHLTIHGLSGAMTEQDSELLARLLKTIPGFTAASPEILTQGLIRGGMSNEPSPVVVKGMELAGEKKVSGILKNLNINQLNPGEALVGRDLARRHGITTGDRITIMFFKPTQTPLGIMPKMRTFTVAGIFYSGIYEYDKTWVLTPLQTLAGILNMKDKIDFLAVRTHSMDTIDRFKRILNSKLPPRFFVIDLRETNKRLFSAIKVEKMVVSLIIGLIMLVAALNITSSLVLMVMEKHRDIGILMAMGMDRKRIMKVFQMQGLVVGVTGATIGTVLGVGISVVLNAFRVLKLPPDVYDFLSYIPFEVRPLDVAVVFIITIAVSWVATLYPSRRAAALDPVEAIRYE